MIDPGVVYLDGQYLPHGEASIPPLTHALHYGLAAFEGIRAYRTDAGKTVIFRLQEHLDRLFHSAKMIHLDRSLPTVDQIRVACHEVLRRNDLREGYLRPVIFSGHGAMGLYAPKNMVRVLIAAWKWGAYLGEEALKKGVRACVSTYHRGMPGSFMAKAKVAGNYIPSILAKAEAKSRGYDEGLMPDATGRIVEGSGENLFYVRNGTLCTPPDASPILHGITRQSILELAHKFEIPVEYSCPPRDLLYLADEVFFTGTAAEVTPVREIDDQVIGNGTPGPMTRKLQEAFFDIVRGRRPAPGAWLDEVDF